MDTLVKTKKSTFWHVKEEGVNGTVCGLTTYSSWEEKKVHTLPTSNVCKECMETLSELEAGVAEVTHPHHTW